MQIRKVAMKNLIKNRVVYAFALGILASNGVMAGGSLVALKDPGEYWVDGVAIDATEIESVGGAPTVRLVPPVKSYLAGTPKGLLAVSTAGEIKGLGGERYPCSSLNECIPKSLKPNETVVSIAVTRDGQGLWALTSQGKVIATYQARNFGNYIIPKGSLKDFRAPVALLPTSADRGYYIVAADGGVFTFGDAQFMGSSGGRVYAQIVAAALSYDISGRENGYWMVDCTGLVTAFGSARPSGRVPMSPGDVVTGMTATAQGDRAVVSKVNSTNKTYSICSEELNGCKDFKS
jgi:hypothetical protein